MTEKIIQFVQFNKASIYDLVLTESGKVYEIEGFFVGKRHHGIKFKEVDIRFAAMDEKIPDEVELRAAWSFYQ